MNRESCHFNSRCDELLKYLLVKTAPVIHGVKPSVLLRLNNCPKLKHAGHYEIFCLRQAEIMRQLKLECRIMKRDEINIQAMFYNPQLLRDHLGEPAHRRFLERHGYRNCHNLEAYLLELHRRFNHGSFPHEIGIFLGYPLKDVAGYMANRGDYVEISRGLWRVFGNPGESARVMNSYRDAEEAMRRSISRYPDVNLFITHYHQTAC
jgi:hypothetical protein